MDVIEYTINPNKEHIHITIASIFHSLLPPVAEEINPIKAKRVQNTIFKEKIDICQTNKHGNVLSIDAMQSTSFTAN